MHGVAYYRRIMTETNEWRLHLVFSKSIILLPFPLFHERSRGAPST